MRCAWCLVWSYNAAVEPHLTRRWLAYNGSYAVLLVLLGAASFVVLEPQFVMAELMDADDALQLVLPHGVPLMVGAAAIGTLALWALYGRKPRALIPILVTQALLVFLVGHNLAILGIVEMTSGLLLVGAEFVGLTVFLAGVFAGGVVLFQILGSRFRPA